MLGLGNILSKGGAIQKFPNEYSFNFDGSNDDLILPSSVAPTGNFTVSAWVYSTGQGTNADNAIYYGNALTLFIAINTTGNYVQTYIGGASGGANTANSTITQNQWHHIAVTWNGSNTKIYIDGDDKSITGNGAGNPGSATTHIGGKPGTSVNQFKGYIDEVGIWNTALDATAIGKISSKPVDLTKHSASNLKLWLRAGDKVQPESNTSIARADYSAEFDGSDYVAISGTGLTLNDFSISGWFYHVDNGNNYQGIIGMQDTTENDYQVGLILQFYDDYFDAEGASVDQHLTKVTANTVGSGILQNSWNHFSYTVDRDGGSGGVKLYINGALATTDTAVDFATKANNIYIGAGYYGTAVQRFFGGSSISNIAIHQTILPANDVALMAKSRFTPMRDFMLKQVDFDGVNDYIDCGASNSIITGTNITLSCWFKSADTDDSKLMQLKRTSSSSNLSLDVNVGGSAGHVGAVVRHSSGSTTVSADGSVDDGAWHHLALTTTSSAQVLYLDGVSIATGTVALVDQFSTDSFTIGAVDGSSYNFGGSLVGVAVYGDTKDADFIYAQYAKGLFGDWSADSGLVGYWKMGNGTGDVYPTIVDQSSNSNNGTITNGASDDIVENMVAGYDLGSFRGSEELGGEIITNSTFDSNVNNWAGSNFAGDEHTALSWQSSGAMRISPNQADSDWRATQATQDIGDALSSSKIYKLVIVAKSNTTRKLRVGSTVSSTGVDLYNSNDTGDELTTEYKTFTAYFVGSTDDIFIGTPHPNGWHADNSTSDYIDVDSISVKEVLSSAVEDTKNAVIDVSNPVLSTEVNTSANASSPSNEADATTGWTTSSATISSVAEAYTSSYSLKVVTSVDNGYALVSSAWTVDNDSTYKLSITWKTDGTQTNEWRYGWGTSGASAQYGSTEVNGSTDWVTSVEYIKTTSTSLHLFVQERNSTSNALALYIDSISIKKVQGNIGKPTSMDATNFPYTSVLPDQSFFTGVNSPYNFIDLDGSDEYIVLGGSSPDTAFSISAWVFDTHASGSDYSAIYASNSTAIWFGVQNNSNGSVRLHINGNSNYADTPSGSFSSPSNQWIHLVGTWDGTNAKIYINEESQTLSVTGTLANPTANANPTIGTNDNSVGLNQWTGKIGQTALWNRGLLDTEVSAIYKLGRHGNLLDSYSDNLVGYWAMGALDALTGLSDVGNGTIYDRSGESNHGTATNTESADLQSPPNAEPEGYDIESTTRTTTTP